MVFKEESSSDEGENVCFFGKNNSQELNTKSSNFNTGFQFEGASDNEIEDVAVEAGDREGRCIGLVIMFVAKLARSQKNSRMNKLEERIRKKREDILKRQKVYFIVPFSPPGARRECF